MRKLILGVTESGMPRKIAVKRAVDLALKMLDAHTDRKGLCFYRIAIGKKALEQGVCTVSNGENEGASGNRPARGIHADDPAASTDERGNGGMEMKLRSKLGKTAADTIHNRSENIRADMGLRAPKDLLGRTEINEGAKNTVDGRVGDTGHELTVRKGPCPARTELNIRFGIKDARGAKGGMDRHALLNGRTALNDDRRIARLGQAQGTKKSRRTRPDDHGTVGQRLLRGKIRLGIRAKQGKAGALKALRGSFGKRAADRDRSNEMNVTSAACIHRFSIESEDGIRRQSAEMPQLLPDRIKGIRIRGVKRKPQIVHDIYRHAFRSCADPSSTEKQTLCPSRVSGVSPFRYSR